MMKKGNGEINVLFLKIQKREKKVTVPKYLTYPTYRDFKTELHIKYFAF